MSRAERALSGWLAERQDAMEALLEELVGIDSKSGDAAGLAAVGARIEAFLAAEGIAVERIEAEGGAALLVAEVGPGDNHRPLLLGHMDTVFPTGTVARRPFHAVGARLHGPGVADMKAGLVMNAFVLAALARFGEGRGARALFTIDEEVASGASGPFILEEARRAAFVLNAEPGRPTGNVVVERKAGLFLRIRVTGRAAHAGVDFRAGASAVTALAHKIVALEGLVDLAAGITVNVGLIGGGQSINTVAPEATAEIDVRYVHPDQRGPLVAALDRVFMAEHVAGTRTEVEVIGEFPPMVPTPESLRLFESYRAVASDLGFAVAGEATGGCSDAGFVSAAGTPVLCGVGPVGGRAHTDDEYLERASLVPRAQAVALTVLRHRPDGVVPPPTTPAT